MSKSDEIMNGERCAGCGEKLPFRYTTALCPGCKIQMNREYGDFKPGNPNILGSVSVIFAAIGIAALIMWAIKSTLGG